MLNLLVVQQKADRKRFDSGFREMLSDSEAFVYYADSEEEAGRLFCENPCRYDAVFLPVSVGAEKFRDVLSAAEKIRQASPYVQIVFMSSFSYIPFSAVESGNSWFLKIPVDVGKLKKVLAGLASFVENNRASGNRMLMLKCGRKRCFVPSSSILYVRKCRNGSAVITEQGELVHSRRLDDFEKELTWTFCRCHSSYIVNFRHVVWLVSDDIMMDDGEIISVSRAYRKNVARFIADLDKERKIT